MSKDTPEVGDVWFEEPTEITFVILSVTDNGGYVFAKYFDGFSDVGFVEIEDFKKLTYLGKSKAKIDDLFKTENEEWQSSDKLILTFMDNIKDKSDLLQRAMVNNTKLKELLKECRDKWVCYKPYDRDQLLKRIDKILADNKIQANTVACNKIQENE